jgi:hypothetical protein
MRDLKGPKMNLFSPKEDKKYGENYGKNTGKKYQEKNTVKKVR